MSEVIINKAKEVLLKMGFSPEVSFVESNANPFLVINIPSEDSGFLIGKAGVNIEALEHVLKLVVSKEQIDVKLNFTLDINDYRRLKTRGLIEAAKLAAERVIQTSKSEALQPMNAYERRLVHLELASYKNIATESIGEDPKRRIVIKSHFTA